MKQPLIIFLCFLILLGFIPIITLFIQFLLVGIHGIKNHYSKCKDYTPNVAIIIPVWNEEDVVGLSIDSLMELNYPRDRLHIYAVDDVSSDKTPEIIDAKTRQYPNCVFNLRRNEKIGFGKAAVINHGLKLILDESWAEAILIIDADVMFEHDTLLRMTRHLADPKVSSVTAYITEGQPKGNIVTHLVGFEYIVAQAATRRAQNVLGTMACLAGGAQLHKRELIELIGGKINTSTLAEDTFTTFQAQLLHNKVVFDGNAIAIAEEPVYISDLWKQRFRWAEGNIQITLAFKNIWFRRGAPEGLGGIFFGLIWFSTLLMPICMIVTSISLDALFFLNGRLSWKYFQMFTLISLCSYLFTTIYSFCIDFKATKRVWFAGVMFPGLISLFNMFLAAVPNYVESLVHYFLMTSSWEIYDSYMLLWVNTWIALCMPCAWLVYRLDRAYVPQIITNGLLLLVGYGPLLCVITFAAYISQLTKREMKWNKTVKTGKAEQKIKLPPSQYDFEKTLARDKRNELRLFYYEIGIIIGLLTLFALHKYYGLS